MDTNTFIGQLRDIRENLHASIRAASALEMKLVGPRPSDPKDSLKQTSESVGSLLSDITGLSTQLQKMLAHQHDILGDFSTGQEAASPGRYA